MIIYDDDGIGHDVVPMSVIEDIKEEIQTEREDYHFAQDYGRYYGLGIALDIIEKHISGKE